MCAGGSVLGVRVRAGARTLERYPLILFRFVQVFRFVQILISNNVCTLIYYNNISNNVCTFI